MTTIERDPLFTECYSDHAHDIRIKGQCDFCGSDDPEVIGYVLPDTQRLRGVDPVEAARRVLDERSMKIVDGVLLDVVTAQAIRAVADALTTDEARAKLRSMPIERAGRVCLKLAYGNR